MAGESKEAFLLLQNIGIVGSIEENGIRGNLS